MRCTQKCPKCGSSDVVADARVVDRFSAILKQDLSIETHRRPKAAVFKGLVRSPVSAWICADCGYMELYASSSKTLKNIKK